MLLSTRKVKTTCILLFVLCISFCSGTPTPSDLINAIEWSTTKRIADLINKGALKAKDAFGNTALHLAAKNNKPKVTDFLIENGVDIKQKNNFGDTALSLAVKYNNAEVKAALEKKENKNSNNSFSKKNPSINSFAMKNPSINNSKTANNNSCGNKSAGIKTSGNNPNINSSDSNKPNINSSDHNMPNINSSDNNKPNSNSSNDKNIQIELKNFINSNPKINRFIDKKLGKNRFCSNNKTSFENQNAVEGPGVPKKYEGEIGDSHSGGQSFAAATTFIVMIFMF